MTLHHESLRDHACLIVHGPDKAGLVAAVTALITRNQGNIVTLDQYSDNPQGGAFFQRVVFNRQDLTAAIPEIEQDLAETLTPYGMQWQLTDQSVPKRMAILASTSDHCLLELLWRSRRGELDAEIVVVASNHPDLRPDVEAEGIRYHHVPVTKETKAQAEEQLLDLLAGRSDLVVLARYMQILSGEFLERLGVPVINIHHSFLPAFAGAGPYERAKERGVKLVGATAHYVTEELDAGPIIEQDVTRVTHHDDVATLTRRGAEIERVVLARAVQWHCEDRVARHGNTTVVF